jgi:hypothetical protein
VSRTDKTKPWLVRVAEHQPWANHDHSNGICDLPENPRDGNNWAVPFACRWSDWNLCRKGTCCYGCGCRMCTNYEGRRIDRRRSRHQARITNRAELKQAQADW